jgi:hypothetical protein
VRLHAALAAPLVTGALVAACSGSSHPAGASLDGPPDGGAGGAGDDAGMDGGNPFGVVDAHIPKPSADSGCGYAAIDVSRKLPNVYFVLDRSGSMGEIVGGKKKMDVLRSATVSLGRSIGYRARIGAAMFPKSGTPGDYCLPGGEVFPLQRGDPKTYADAGLNGPVTAKLTLALAVSPFGNTPTASTLVALTPMLTAAGPDTYVILATDGGPNCGTGGCGIEQCISNIEAVSGCTGTLNCCDPAMVEGGRPELCVDANATLSAVSSLAASGVKVIVVGISGTAYYQGLLDALAVAGGAPRKTTPRYYRVDALDELESTFAGIGNDVIVSCDFELDAAPPMPNNVNVYLDDTLVYADPVDGWTYTSATTVTLHGKSCAALQAGTYESAQVYEGCPSETPNPGLSGAGAGGACLTPSGAGDTRADLDPGQSGPCGLGPAARGRRGPHAARRGRRHLAARRVCVPRAGTAGAAPGAGGRAALRPLGVA